MRIIAGVKRGMKLLSPKTQESRPITDRVKESLFSVLYKYDLPNGKMVADLFCGVGSLGLEALSRGAEFVTFIEKNLKIITILEKNVEKAGFAKESKVVRADAFKIGATVDPLRPAATGRRWHGGRIAASEQKYDLIFVDPPYSTTRETKEGSPLSELLVILQEQLAPNGIAVVRTNRRTELLEQYGRLQIIEQRQWGTMAVTILQQKSR
jgi:16S rRNA (guanine966-N2)-methyltransferase